MLFVPQAPSGGQVCFFNIPFSAALTDNFAAWLRWAKRAKISPLTTNADPPQKPPARACFCLVSPHPISPRKTFMEAERINTIAATLEDLTQRTGDLRGYL